MTICLSSEVESIISDSVPFALLTSLRGPNDFMEGEDESPAPNATCEAAGLNSEDEEVDDNSSDYYNKTSHSFMVILCFVPPIIPTFKSCLYILKGSEGIFIF